MKTFHAKIIALDSVLLFDHNNSLFYERSIEIMIGTLFAFLFSIRKETFLIIFGNFYKVVHFEHSSLKRISF